MDIGLVQTWLPTANTLVALLDGNQRQWMNAHAAVMPQFLASERGQAALLIYLEEFSEYVEELKKIAQKAQQPHQVVLKPQQAAPESPVPLAPNPLQTLAQQYAPQYVQPAAF